MINNVKNILNSHLEWIQDDLLFLIMINLGAGLLDRLLHLNYFIENILVIVLFFLNINFSHKFLLLPSIGSDTDRFSWKFFQGLPINKNALLLAMGCSFILSYLPLFIFLIIFWKIIILFTKDVFLINLLSIYKVIINLILIFFIFGVGSVSNVIRLTRIEFQRKKSTAANFLSIIRGILFVIVSFIYFFIGASYLKTEFNIDVFKYFNYAQEALIIMKDSWLSPLILALICYRHFHSVLMIWMNEKLSYRRESRLSNQANWAIVACLLAMIIIPMNYIEITPPSLATGNKLIQAVHEKDYKKIESIISHHEIDINIKNQFGVTPLMIAILEGDLKTVKLLEENGASFDGSINIPHSSQNGFNSLLFAIESKKPEMIDYLLSRGLKINTYSPVAGLYPIHLAASKCDSRLLDHVLQRGADLKLRNAKGETPLLVAARQHCFSAITSLKEAGADFNVEDLTGRRATDYYKGNLANSEAAYYIEKNSRLPASN